MDKERFTKVLNASLLMYDGMSFAETEELIDDKGAIIIAKLLNRFIISYGKKKDEIEVKEDKEAPESHPLKEIEENKKPKLSEEDIEHERTKLRRKYLNEREDATSGNSVSVDESPARARISF